MLKKKSGIRLLKRYLFGEPTPEEKAVVDKWYNSVEENEETEDVDAISEVGERIFVRSWDQLQSGISIIPIYRKKYFRVAASILLILSGGLLVYFLNTTEREKNESDSLVGVVEANNDISAPEVNKATLTLADGSTIILESTDVGALAQQGKVQITKLTNGEIVYNSHSDASDEIQFNTLSVPKGSKPMQLVLSDGSRVWINVASSVTYPTSFRGIERKVEITGEVYFEVASIGGTNDEKNPEEVNKRLPFIVSAPSRLDDGRSLTVRVLGTHFNVNAYEDERSSKVTLLEGSVLVEAEKKKSLYLKPEQQVELNETGNLSLHSDIDIEEVMAWKNNWFIFNSLTMPEVMRQIEKWYDITVVYAHPVENKHFSGIVSRNNNLSEVLKILEHGGIRFNIEGKKITVM